MRRFLPIFFAVAILFGCRWRVTISEVEPLPPKPVSVELGYHILYLNKGEEVPGRLEKIDSDGTVYFTRLSDGETLTYKKGDILRIDFQKKRLDDDKKNISEIDDNLLKSALSYPAEVQNFPQASYVILYSGAFVEVKSDLSASITKRVVAKVLTKQGRAVGNQSIEYLGDWESVEILFARTILPDSTLLHLAENALEVGSVFGAYPDYENQRRVKFTLKEVKEGSVVDFCYRIDRKPAQILHPLLAREYFKSLEPIVRKEFVVVAPKGVELSITARNLGENVNYLKESDEAKTRYSWVAVNAPRFERESDMPPYPDTMPNVVVTIQEDWGRIGREFAAVLAQNLVVDESLKNRVETITEGKSTPVEKARALYAFVAQQIRNLQISPSQSSYTVHELPQILSRGQANPLDKAFLLYGMLKSSGFDVHYLLCLPRSQGAFPKQNPCLSLLSSPALLVKIEEDTFYLALFSDSTDFGYIPPYLQGAAALLIDEKEPQLVEIPLLPASEEFTESTTAATLTADGTIKAKTVRKALGHYASEWRQLGNLRPEELKQSFEKRVAEIHSNARLLSFNAGNLKDLNSPVVIEYEYEIPDYALKAGTELMAFRLPEIDYSASSIEKWERTLPLFWANTFSYRNFVRVVIPETYEVRYIPESVQSYSGYEPFTYYRARFTLDDDAVVFTDECVRNSVLENAVKYASLLDAIQTSARVSNEWVVLEAKR
jgi:hypothetical protein